MIIHFYPNYKFNLKATDVHTADLFLLLADQIFPDPAYTSSIFRLLFLATFVPEKV